LSNSPEIDVNDNELIEWLLLNAGPSIRYRTAHELTGAKQSELKKLKDELLESRPVKKWLDNLIPGTLHHSKNTAFENAMGKLVELGMHVGIPPFDKKIKPFREWLSQATDYQPDVFSGFYKSLVTGALVRAGFTKDKKLRAFLHGRLASLYETTGKKKFNIYLTTAEKKGFSRKYIDKPMLRPELIADGEYRFPFIHDAYALANFPEDMIDATTRKKINSVVNYILDPEYQAFPNGYGYFRTEDNRYFAMGWDIALPGYNKQKSGKWYDGFLIQRLELMAHFPVARKHKWFKVSLNKLEGFRTDSGTYQFPRDYLRESEAGYYVCGAHMGIEENRRASKAIEIESTFRMMKIRKLIKG
jgi:hypothetical protein